MDKLLALKTSKSGHVNVDSYLCHCNDTKNSVAIKTCLKPTIYSKNRSLLEAGPSYNLTLFVFCCNLCNRALSSVFCHVTFVIEPSLQSVDIKNEMYFEPIILKISSR